MISAMPVSGAVATVAIGACLTALAFIALLPRIFFRPGRLNARWWLTAAPFGVAGASLVGRVLGVLEPIPAGAPGVLPGALSTVLAGAAIALIGWTLRSHEVPVSLWHQENDRPHRLVSTGAYGRVRHPFYAAFLLTLAACVIAFPHPLTALALIAGYLQLDRTAAREEARLGREFGGEYAAYIGRTGRFIPSLRSRAPFPTGEQTIGEDVMPRATSSLIPPTE